MYRLPRSRLQKEAERPAAFAYTVGANQRQYGPGPVGAGRGQEARDQAGSGCFVFWAYATDRQKAKPQLNLLL